MDFSDLDWKRVWKIIFFGLRSGQDLKNRAAHPTKNSQVYPPWDVKLEPGLRTAELTIGADDWPISRFAIFTLLHYFIYYFNTFENKKGIIKNNQIDVIFFALWPAAESDFRRVLYAFWPDIYRFPINMAFAANLLENEILVVPGWGICTVFKPHGGVLYESPGPTVGHLQLFKCKNDKRPTTNARGVEGMGTLGIDWAIMKPNAFRCLGQK